MPSYIRPRVKGIKGSGQNRVILYAKVEVLFLPCFTSRAQQVFHKELPEMAGF